MDEILDTVEVSNTRGVPRYADPEQGKIRIRKPAAFLKMIQGFEEQKRKAVSKLQSLLSNLTEYVSRNDLNGTNILSDLAFLQFCSLDDCARSAPDGMFTPQKRVRVTFSKNILDEWNSSLLIVAAPGYGKTSFCRWHALKDAEDYTASKSDILPVYLQLHRFSTKGLGSFEDTFLQTLSKSALVGASNKDGKTRIRIYMDGLDEIASSKRRKEIVELARTGAKGNPKYQILLTSRDQVHARWLEWLPRISLGEFTGPEINELLDKWLGRDTESRDRFSSELRKVPSLAVLMQIPLLATLTIMVFRQTAKLPETKVRLYEIFIDILSGGWDVAKGIIRESKFEKRIKVMILRTLASKLHEQRRRAFDTNDLKGIVRVTTSKAVLKDWELLRDELLTDGLITGTGDIYQFSHFSFQEFLTAKEYMGSPNSMHATEALDSYLQGEDWWKEVINFYIALSTNPREAVQWLINEIRVLQAKRNIAKAETYLDDLFANLLEAFPEYPLEQLVIQLKPIQKQVESLQAKITESALRKKREEFEAEMKVIEIQ